MSSFLASVAECVRTLLLSVVDKIQPSVVDEVRVLNLDRDKNS